MEPTLSQNLPIAVEPLAVEDERVGLDVVKEALKLKSRNAVFSRVKAGLLAQPVKDGKFNFWFRSDLIAYDRALRSQRNQPRPASS